MKRFLILTAALALAATPAFAGTSVTMDLVNSTGLSLYGAPADATASTATLIGKCSTGVGVGALVSDLGGGYALVTQHKSGTKAYGTSYDSTAIYTTVADQEPGVAALDVPTATDTTDFAGSDWKAM